MPRMFANVYHGVRVRVKTALCHIYFRKRSLQYISLTKCYDDMGSFHIFGILLKYIRIYYVCLL